MVAPNVDGIVEPLASITRYGILRAAQQGRRVYVVSGLRTAAEQRALRVAHCPDPENSRASECSPPTAPVGSSKHQKGTAVDMGGAKETFAALTAPFGFHRPVRGEDWHFEHQGDGAKSMKALRSAVVDADIPVGDVFTGGTIPTEGGIDLPGLPAFDIPGLDRIGVVFDLVERITSFFETDNLLRIGKGLVGVWLIFGGAGVLLVSLFSDELAGAARGAAAGATGGPAGAAAGATAGAAAS